MGSAILLEGFFGHQQRHQFALRDLEGGEAADFAVVIITEFSAVIFHGQIHAVAQEFDVALDGLGGNFQRFGQLAAVRETAGLELLVQSQHSFQRRPGEAVGAIPGLGQAG